MLCQLSKIASHIFPISKCLTYPFKVVKILLEGFPCLSMGRLVCYVRIFFVSWTLVIFRAMCFPIAQAHPTEVMFTVVTLHVITTTIFLNTDVAFWALRENVIGYMKKKFSHDALNLCLTYIFRMSWNIIGRFTIVCTFGEPSLDSLTSCWRVVLATTVKTAKFQKTYLVLILNRC